MKTEWRHTKKLGSLLDSTEDIKRRKVLATAAFSSLNKLWFRQARIDQKRKLQLYNALVTPILLYNCGTWAITKKESSSLDAFHRRQIRRLLGITWEDKVKNQDLYDMSGCQPISTTIASARGRLLGHILRLDTNSPAQIATSDYFRPGHQPYRGRPPTNIHNTINNDLKCIEIPHSIYTDHSYSHPQLTTELRTTQHLDTLRRMAQNKEEWRRTVRFADGSDWQATPRESQS